MKYQKPEMANMSQLLVENSASNVEVPVAATIAILVAVVVVWVAATE